MSQVLAWERQDGEPEEAWDAFCRYRDMHPPRRIEWAAPKSNTILFGWANEWRWHERTVAYDRHTDAIRRAEKEAMLKQSENDRMASALKILAGMEDLFERELKKLLAESYASDMSIAKINDLTKLSNNIITMRRLVHGESTENVHTSSEFDLSKLSLDELRKFKELQSKIGKDGAGE